MESDSRPIIVHPLSEQSPEPQRAVCEQCGHRITSSTRRLRVGDCSFICDQCYKYLSFPDSVIRCSE